MRLSLSLIALFCFSIFSGCSRPTDDFNLSKGTSARDRVSRMSAEERQKTAPNLLFQKVLEGDVEGVRNVVKATPSLLASRNEVDENTALGLALILREKEIASHLIDELSFEHYQDQNGKGESYVFLAAKAGYHDLILKLADRYYNNHGGLDRFHFSDLDLENNLGQRALHVAADRITADVLWNQYYRATLGAPYWQFTLKIDDLGQSFLHTAAADGRTDVLLWGSQQFCSPSRWETEGHWYTRYPYTAASRAGKVVQTYISDVGAYFATLFNRQDNEGNTALHRAIAKRNIHSIRALAQCRWLDYYLANNEGNIPLQASLLQLPIEEQKISAPEREAFDFIFGKTTKLRRWITPYSEYLNHPNQLGQTSLHLAAQLADPSFFEALAKDGNIYAKDKHEHTPLELYEQKKNRVKLYAH